MDNPKGQKHSVSSNSRISRSDDNSSAEDSSNDSQIKAYVSEFKKEVERKFTASKTNIYYRFPRKTIQNDKSKHSKEDSLESLKDVTFYDLESQNVKKALLNPLNANRASETEFLVDVIKKMGKLDHRYLASQMRNSRSPFFKILYTSIQRKVSKDRKSVESLKSASIKTKSIVLAKKNSQFKTCTKNPDSTTFQKNFLASGYHHLHNPSNTTSNVQMFANMNSNLKLNQDCHIMNHVPSRTNHSSVSPSNQSHASFRSKTNQKTESLKIQGKLRKNFSGNTCIKSTINKSASNVNRLLKNASSQNSTSVFNLVKKNVLNTNANSSQIHSQSKSRSRDPPSKVTTLVLPMANTSKNQISLTKDQLRSLIQKNIYKKTPHDPEIPKLKITEKSLSRSSKKQSDKLMVNLYNNPGSTSQNKPTKRKETFKRIY